jgi:transposase
MKTEQDQNHRDKRGRYTQEFKRSVVDQLLIRGKSVRRVADEFGVNQWTLKEWKRKYGAVARAPDAPMPATPEAMKQEIEQLRKELARVRLQRDILKETMGIRPRTGCGGRSSSTSKAITTGAGSTALWAINHLWTSNTRTTNNGKTQAVRVQGMSRQMSCIGAGVARRLARRWQDGKPARR